MNSCGEGLDGSQYEGKHEWLQYHTSYLSVQILMTRKW